jgi:DNA-binding protein H-NS
MAIDLTTLNPKQLEKLIAEARRERQRQQKRAPIVKVRAKLTRLASAEGYTLMELFGVRAGAPQRAARSSAAGKRPAAASSTKGSKVPPKYRNPANPAETWSGRGKHPRWMTAAMANGKRPEDFLI